MENGITVTPLRCFGLSSLKALFKRSREFFPAEVLLGSAGQGLIYPLLISASGTIQIQAAFQPSDYLLSDAAAVSFSFVLKHRVQVPGHSPQGDACHRGCKL